jgi:hypothetical protein
MEASQYSRKDPDRTLGNQLPQKHSIKMRLTTDQSENDTGGGRLVVKAYAASILFVGLFVVLLAYGSKLASSLSDPAWALLVAIALTAPVLVPWLTANVLPRIRSIKISEVEIALQETRAAIPAVSHAMQDLRSQLADNPVLSEYAGRMTSHSNSIINAIKAVQGAGHQVLPVDLATPWVAPNLYFLALMAAQKTRVQQIVFVDSRFVPDRFVCMSSPDEVLAALEWQRAELREAALAARFDQYPQSAELQAGSEFFQQLGQVYNRTPDRSNYERIMPFTPETLLWTLGPAAHGDSIQWVEPPGEKEYRGVLAYESPFVAALKGNQLLFLVSRDRVAIAVARAFLRSS